MEEHLDKLIYVIIAVVIAIISAVSNSKKKKAIKNLNKTTPTPVNSGSKPLSSTPPNLPGFDTLFETIKETKPADTIVEEEPIEIKPAKKQEPKVKEYSYEEIAYENKDEIEIDSIIDDFDPQKAIIYSEIINKKHD